jgi:hypothetical protein
MRIVLYAIYSDAKRQGYQNWQVTPDVQEAILRIFEPEVYKNG